MSVHSDFWPCENNFGAAAATLHLIALQQSIYNPLHSTQPGVVFPTPLSFVISLHTSDSGSGQDATGEITAAEYARQAVTFDDGMNSTQAVNFATPATNAGNATHYAIWAEQSAGIWLKWWVGEITNSSGDPSPAPWTIGSPAVTFPAAGIKVVLQ